jgi:hypothetical protein
LALVVADARPAALFALTFSAVMLTQ